MSDEIFCIIYLSWEPAEKPDKSIVTFVLAGLTPSAKFFNCARAESKVSQKKNLIGNKTFFKKSENNIKIPVP